jgi:enterochelin esterase family protein
MMSTQPDTAASSDAVDGPLPSTAGRPSRFLAQKNANGGRLSAPAMLSGGQSIAGDLVPFIDRAFRTRADRDHRAITGMSASGAASFHAAMSNLPLFGWIGIFGGGWPALPGVWVKIPTPPNAGQFNPDGPDINQSIDPGKVAELLPTLNAKANLRLLYLSSGTNDPLMTTHALMKQLLDERGVQYVNVEVPGYHHDWRFWRRCLADFAPRLFTGDTP